MAVTSEKLLAFIGEASNTVIKYDENQDVSSVVPPLLSGEPLAKALEIVANLAATEEHLAFGREQFDAQTGTVKYTGPQAVN
jgi:hypothetical protein